jgi:hypothetical protein
MSWIPGMKRQSRIGSLGQLLREPPGLLAHGLSLLCSHMHCRNTSGMPAQLLAGPPYLAAAPVRHSRSHKV